MMPRSLRSAAVALLACLVSSSSVPGGMPAGRPNAAAPAISAAIGGIDRVSVASNGTEGDDRSRYASVSGDGRHVAFHSDATNLVPDDDNGRAKVFLYSAQASAYLPFLFRGR